MDKVNKVTRNPRKSYQHIVNKLKEFLFVRPGRKYLYNRYGGPVNAIEKDWDNLIILDACRYDTFAEVNTLPGELDYRLSNASATMEWVQNSIGNKEFNDVVYVTANPRVNRYEGQFYNIIPAWKTHWDEELKVVLPATLADLTIEAYEMFPEKRIIAHFMQPHIPFIGDFGRSEIGIYDGTTKGRDRALRNEYSSNKEPYDLLKSGNINSELIKRAYKENVQVTLPEVKRLFETLHGKFIVTADHGEMFGEIGWPAPFRVYGHSNRSPARQLLKVPWLEYLKGDRRSTTAEISEKYNEKYNEDEIKDRLKHLGYR